MDTFLCTNFFEPRIIGGLGGYLSLAFLLFTGRPEPRLLLDLCLPLCLRGGVTSLLLGKLFGALLGMMRVHGKAILAEVVVPTLCRAELSAGQLEALQRLLKEAPADGLGTALGAYLAADGGVPASWSDAQASVLQTLLARKPALDERTLADLVLHIDANGHAGAKSLKFANLLNTVVRGYAQQLRPHVAILQRVADTLETFMKKGILAALGKLAAVPTDRES